MENIVLYGGIVLGSYLLMVLTWVMYLAIMQLIPHRHTMHPIAKVHAYILVAIGLLMDTLLNVFVASVILLQPPREFLLTDRLQRNIILGGWRGKVSKWICEHLLDQFDPKGHHC